MHSTSNHPWTPSQQRKQGVRCSKFSRCFAHFALHSSLFASRGRESCCVGCATLRRRERYQVERKPTGSVLHVLSHQRRPDDQELRWKDPRSTRRQRLAYRESPQTLCNHWLSGLPTKLSPFPDNPPRRPEGLLSNLSFASPAPPFFHRSNTHPVSPRCSSCSCGT